MKAKIGILSSSDWPSDMPDDRRVIALLGLVQILEEGMKIENCGLCRPCAEGRYDECETFAFSSSKDAEIARLTDLVAMQSEALISVRAYLIPRVSNSGTTGRTIIMPEVENAISATAETVSAWQSKRDKELLESIASWFPQDGSDEYMRLRDIEAKIAELRAKGE